MSKQFEARMYEAGSANSRLVVVTVETGRLIIDNSQVLSLDHMDVEVAGHEEDRIQLHDSQTGTAIMCMDRAHELLEALYDADTSGHLRKRASEIQKKVRSLPWMKGTYWLRVAGCLVAILVGLHFMIDAMIDIAADRVDPSLEKKIGEYCFNSGKKKYDRTSDNYKRIERIGKRLTGNLKNCPYQFNFYVDDTSVVNAYAFPGGFLVVNKGLIDKATSDDEIAGVMGHEIGHVIHRDTVHTMMHSAGVLCCVGMVAGLGGDYAREIAQALSVGRFLEGQSFSRAKEASCDLLGADLCAQSGYDAEGLAKFFQRMESSSDGTDNNKVVELLSDHPLDSARVDAIKAEVEKLKKVHPEWFATKHPPVPAAHPAVTTAGAHSPGKKKH